MTARRVAALAAAFAAIAAVAGGALTIATLAQLEPPPESLRLEAAPADTGRFRVLDRRGEPLSVTFTNDWNLHDRVALHDVPPFLTQTFIAAEDKRFYEHGGTDWIARAAALAANIESGRAVRGASTISEQVVRMLNPRPRTLWSRWLEGFEAARLERAFGKSAILDFYLNQVPYAANRRGIGQAASFYFDRDIGTLSRKEMLALAVLVRAPSRLDLKRGGDAAEGAIARLAGLLVGRGALSAADREAILAQPLVLAAPRLPAYAPHFVRHVRREAPAGRAAAGQVATTLDASLESEVQALLDERLDRLAPHAVHHGAVLVVEHGTGQVLAWVVGGGADPEGPATHIDAVTTPRQPGSALKPFLYALALDGGWTAATVIDDAPLTESTSGGLHSYRNYSGRYYGPVTLRDALGNSLNIPAVKTLQQVGAQRYLDTLRALGFAGLTQHPDHYGDGIALGTGAVTLFELVQAYAALANGGVFRPLTTLLHDPGPREPKRIFSAEAASLIANILSDSDARALEFGRDSVLRFPVQTAVKTGTSSDFRDAWAVGFDDRYAVGVWLGNLDRTPTAGLTGSTGPALLLRSVFSELTRGERTRPLYLSPALTRHEVCVPAPRGGPRAAAAPEGEGPASVPEPCLARAEWFLPGTAPATAPATAMKAARAAAPPPPRFRQPTNGLRLAFDPRLPAAAQAFELVIDGVSPDDRVRWVIDGEAAWSAGGTFLWPVAKGDHEVAASVWREGVAIATLRAVEFTVK